MMVVDDQDGRCARRFSNARGFTLIELLIVMILLGLLAALVAPKMFQKVGSSKLKAAKAQISMLGTALMPSAGYGRYPSRDEGISAPQEPVSTAGMALICPKKYHPIRGDVPLCLCCPGEHGDYDLYSLGGDGQQGGDGENSDVTSWD
jgi:general secretion pathway protein G